MFKHIQQPKINTIDLSFLMLLLFTIVFVPHIPLTPSFNLNLEELLLVYPFVRVVTCFKKDLLSLILISFSIFIVFTIVINGHYKSLNEYFEVLKTVKFLIIFQFASSLFQQPNTYKKIIKAIHLIFILSFIINILHYFDFFNFTRTFLIYYDPNGIDTQYYGLNSIGEASAKRIIGTFGNPNENGIFFLFLTLFYSTQVKYSAKVFTSFNFYALIASSIMVVLTQSRTSMLVLAILFLLHLIYHWKNKAYILVEIINVSFIAFILFSTNESAMDYINNTSIVVTENSSVMGRMEVWKLLLNQWLEKPFFGYGPNKNYLYSNNIYPENEYIFFLWRYGIIGLAFFGYLLLQPFFMLGKSALKNEFAVGLFVILSVSALTNVPFFNPKFIFIIAISYGYLTTLKLQHSKC